MVKSMTGYGRGIYEGQGIHMEIEIKTVNHKYLDINIRLPKMLNPVEQEVKKMIQSRLERGRCDVYINLDAALVEETDVKANIPLALSVYEALQETWKKLPNRKAFAESFEIGDLMRIPNFLNFETKDLDADLLLTAAESAVNQALDTLTKTREDEGKALERDLFTQLDLLNEVCEKLTDRAPLVLEEYKARLQEKVAEWLTEAQEEKQARLGMEIVLYSDKTDVNEEIARLNSHIEQMKDVLQKKGAIGKQLDFICQEMNREVNTIGSKSNDIQITKQVIMGKTLIEKIREQVQNIE